jgi:hypothetical protein
MSTDSFCFYLQNRLIQTSQTGGQRYSDTSHFSIPWPLIITIAHHLKVCPNILCRKPKPARAAHSALEPYQAGRHPCRILWIRSFHRPTSRTSTTISTKDRRADDEITKLFPPFLHADKLECFSRSSFFFKRELTHTVRCRKLR